MHFLIREYSESDKDYIWKLVLESDLEHLKMRRKINDEERSNYIGEHRKFFERSLAENNNKIFVAVDNSNTVLGFIWLKDEIDSISLERYLFIFDFVVKKDYRGYGIGTQLLIYAINFCHNREISLMKLEVEILNQSAKSLYEKFGFYTEKLIMAKKIKSSNV